MCTMCTCSGLKILINGELTAFPLCNILCKQVWSQPPPQALRFSQGRGERLVMSRKGPWEGYKRERERDVWVRGRCEAMFSTEQLRIFKCTWIKCLLETNLASSVKPSIVTGYIIKCDQTTKTELKLNLWSIHFVVLHFFFTSELIRIMKCKQRLRFTQPDESNSL